MTESSLLPAGVAVRAFLISSNVAKEVWGRSNSDVVSDEESENVGVALALVIESERSH
eukprot:CAMPEP_0175824094 /NCGR_PEP_ID=MMETSP0107_2-20121207/10547_1 /TAXON_ID=195067 ORGANISM="Goniomonas pacifica, Strain CCMP1869" /NCGR_SAMPLE_ID=MMETSP0107_2 /ASSEMBLY_ACC=CAM_ASM_000203 /LENGTH=57 /DNA_ID=CAMNT_0017136641 /DNA_START=503 /DNA_END=676 /DNA_ORIENTATION=+